MIKSSTKDKGGPLILKSGVGGGGEKVQKNFFSAEIINIKIYILTDFDQER